MPRKKRVGKRPRATKAPRIVSLVLDFEEPLREAREFVQVMVLIGRGIMMDDEDDGCAVVAAAWETSQRLDTLRAAWDALFEAAKKAKA